jgi:hypothetical protein
MSLLVVGAFPLASEASSLDVRLGAFFPRAESNLFRDDAELYLHHGQLITKGDWTGFAGGAQFNFEVAPYAELGFSIDGYSRTLDTSYRDFVSESDREIYQTLHLATVPVAVQLRLGPTQRGRISPYVAIGGDMIFYQYEEYGDFIDFDVPSQPIIPDSFISEGVGWGFHAAAGLRMPLSHDFSLNGEFKYTWAKDDMPDDFQGNEIDLGGITATLGVNVRF